MNEMMREVRSAGSLTTAPLFQPVQSAPINRTPAGAALAIGSGVEAAGWWDIVKKIGSGIGTVGDTLFQ